MADRTVHRALISVYDKTGIVDFARGLRELGVDIISTGGTAALLIENQIPVTTVETITGSAELLDGRVKTLHPNIHAAILADRDNPEHMRQLQEQGIKPIDMVVVNLYPFEKTVADPACTFEQAIEMIDIGGVALLRAAAKNFKHVLVVDNPEWYGFVLDCLKYAEGSKQRTDLYQSNAGGAFWRTAGYDSEIAGWLSRNPNDGRPDVRTLRLWSWGPLRYGENPHQQAELLSLYGDTRETDLTSSDAAFETVQPPMSSTNFTQPMSFNNFTDANAALDLCEELTRAHPRIGIHSCVFVKHTNPCGCAAHPDRIEAYRRAYLGDPSSAMGGVLAVSFAVDVEFAEAVTNSLQRWGKDAGADAFFLEVWLAPGFDDEAVEFVQAQKAWGKKLRWLVVGDMSAAPSPAEMDFKRIAGGLLMQSRDVVGLDEEKWRVVTRRGPTDREMDDLRLAWLICKHTKSNAISICWDGMLLGNGAGQSSRVMSCRVATWLAQANGHAERLKGAVAASDGFFPFRDGPDLLIQAGVSALVQPGGSKRDAETIAACDEHDAAMIFTGTRHFRH